MATGVDSLLCDKAKICGKAEIMFGQSYRMDKEATIRYRGVYQGLKAGMAERLVQPCLCRFLGLAHLGFRGSLKPPIPDAVWDDVRCIEYPFYVNEYLFVIWHITKKRENPV